MDQLYKFLSVIDTMRDSYHQHSARVADHAIQMARLLDMNNIEAIRAGARLHDMGKILIDNTLLNLKRKLTPDEYKRVQQHARLGWAIAAQMNMEAITQRMILSHHERIDGKGYPEGLRGEAIPLEARLLAICDVYDALISERPHREAYSHNFAQSYIQSGKGTAFDSTLVDLFFENVTKPTPAAKPSDNGQDVMIP